MYIVYILLWYLICCQSVVNIVSSALTTFNLLEFYRRGTEKVPSGLVFYRRGTEKVPSGFVFYRRGTEKVPSGLVFYRRGTEKVPSGLVFYRRGTEKVPAGFVFYRRGKGKVSSRFVFYKHGKEKVFSGLLFYRSGTEKVPSGLVFYWVGTEKVPSGLTGENMKSFHNISGLTDGVRWGRGDVERGVISSQPGEIYLYLPPPPEHSTPYILEVYSNPLCLSSHCLPHYTHISLDQALGCLVIIKKTSNYILFTRIRN